MNEEKSRPVHISTLLNMRKLDNDKWEALIRATIPHVGDNRVSRVPR